MKSLKRVFFVISMLLVLIAGIFVFFIATFDANRYKNQIIHLVKEKTGRNLQLNGDIKLSVFPNIALNLTSATISNAPEFGHTPFTTISSTQIGVQLIPLLKKKLVVEKVIFDGLQLNLHTKVNGHKSWDFSTANAETNATNTFTHDFLKNLSIAGIELNNSNIHWQNDITQQNFLIRSLNITTGAFQPTKPIEINLNATVQQKQSDFSLSGNLLTTLTLSNNNQYFNLNNTRLKATATGSPFSDIEFSGNIKGTTEQLHSADLELHLIATKTLLPKGQLQVNLKGDTTFNIKQRKIKIPKMNLQAIISDLPHAGVIIKTTINGDTLADLAKKQLTISEMKLHLESQHLVANNSQSNVQLRGETTLDLATLLLTIQKMQLNTKVTKLFKNAGEATANLKGNLHANLKDLLVDIDTIKLITNAKNLPQISHISTNITGRLKADIKQQQFILKNTNIKTNLKGTIISNGNLSAQLSSTNILANTKIQHFKLKGMRINATLKGGLISAGQLVHSSKGNIDINLSKNKGTAQLNHIVLKMAGAKLTGNAKLTSLSPQPTFVGKFKTNQFNLKQVLNTLGIKLPPTSNKNAYKHSQASFQLTATPISSNIRALTLRLDQSKLTGNIAIYHFKQPIIKTKLAINQLILDDYLPPVTSSPSTKDHANKKLLPIEILKSLRLESVIDIKKLHFDQLKLANVHANIKAKNGMINAAPLRFNAFKGRYNGELNINIINNTPIIKMKHHIQQLRAENLLLQFFQDRYISGDILLNTNLTTRGNTLATLKQNLNGTANLELRKGTIRDSKLAQKIELTVAAFEKRKTSVDGKTTVTFSKLIGKWKINKGIFSTDNMQLLAPHFLIKGLGNINIVKKQLNLKLQLGSKNKDNKLFAPLHIHGFFEKLKYELELDVLLKALLDEKLYQKTEQLKQKLLDEKNKALEKLETRKQTELEKLKTKTEQAQQRLKEEQDKLKQRLQAEQSKVQQMLDEAVNNKLKDTLDRSVIQPERF